MEYKRAFLSGLCWAAVLRGIRHGYEDLKASSIAASEAVGQAPSRANRSIPVKSLSELLGDYRGEIRLSACGYRDGQLPMEEALALVSLLVKANPRVVMEIGTYFGDTTRTMAANLPEAVIHTVDLPLNFNPAGEAHSQKDDFHLISGRKVGEAFRETEYAARITQHLGDTATWDFTLAKGATFFFIDGSHTYAYCKSDSEKCYALCGGRGVFIWHDCDDTHPGVLQFVEEWRAMGRDIVRIKGTPLGYWSSL